MQKRPIEPTQVQCEICLKEIPASEARSAEAQDYVHHFCGLTCYERWTKQHEPEKRQD